MLIYILTRSLSVGNNVSLKSLSLTEEKSILLKTHFVTQNHN
jgi:hypothetical protein